ncbi:MAG TPA: GTP cyclohydrolase I FolE [Candidatus Saccharimonadales bacterium]|nr:GTP cyclohydrolase I FolE [Candidatus Saccharimonadales bacterium]
MPEPHESIVELLKFMDRNPEREGLRKTPERYEKFLKDFFTEKPFRLTAFKNEGYDEMVIQTNIAFYSMCEHHVLPFFGYGAIAYIPDEKIVGLSKLARTLTHFSRRLQTQERLTVQVTEYLEDKLKPKGIGVVLTGRHLCMEMRGVEKPGTQTTTSCLRGSFKRNSSTRGEFLQIVQSNLIQ